VQGSGFDAPVDRARRGRCDLGRIVNSEPVDLALALLTPRGAPAATAYDENLVGFLSNSRSLSDFHDALLARRFDRCSGLGSVIFFANPIGTKLRCSLTKRLSKSLEAGFKHFSKIFQTAYA
jgi:hypothetical protein